MDWQRCAKNAELVAYYKGLIALRKQMPGLCDKSTEAGERVITARQLGKDAAALLLDNHGGEYPELLAAFNASDKAVDINLPLGKWAVLADEASSLLWEDPAAIAGIARLPAMSALILGRIKD